MSSLRLLNEGKPEYKSSSRKESDINKIKMKAKRVPKFGGRIPKGTKKVVNNASIHPRMLPSQVARLKFRQEIEQITGKRKLPKYKKQPMLKKLDSKKYVRVSNNLFRNEESVLDQSERVVFSRNIKREMSQKLNNVKFGQDRKISNILTTAHLLEKQNHADKDKQFISEFTGPTKTLVEVPQMKQQLNDNMNIQKRASPSHFRRCPSEACEAGKDIELTGAVKKFADKLGIDLKI